MGTYGHHQSHDDLHNSPAIPAFMSTSRKSRSPSLSTVISGAATKALGESSEQRKEGNGCTSAGTYVGVSPGKAVDLRIKNYQQLRYIQQLFDDGILTEAEYIEQKRDILSSLKRQICCY